VKYTVNFLCTRLNGTQGADRVILAIGPSIIGYPRIYESGFVFPVRSHIAPLAYGQFFLFNGAKSQTRCAFEIFNCFVLTQDLAGSPLTVHWKFGERRGNTIGWSVYAPSGVPNENPADFTLTIVPHTPLLWPLLYGTPPDDISDAYIWEYVTDWTKDSVPETVWAKVAAA
jgi:hypothetical protein